MDIWFHIRRQDTFNLNFKMSLQLICKKLSIVLIHHCEVVLNDHSQSWRIDGRYSMECLNLVCKLRTTLLWPHFLSITIFVVTQRKICFLILFHNILIAYQLTNFMMSVVGIQIMKTFNNMKRVYNDIANLIWNARRQWFYYYYIFYVSVWLLVCNSI